jgi:hypothetical protein
MWEERLIRYNAIEMRSVHDSGLFFGSAKDEVRRTYRNQIQNNAFLSRRSKWTVSTSDTLTAAVAR